MFHCFIYCHIAWLHSWLIEIIILNTNDMTFIPLMFFSTCLNISYAILKIVFPTELLLTDKQYGLQMN